MEIPNPLEKLSILEKKIASLLEMLKQEKEINAKLNQEKEELLKRLDNAESTLLKETQDLEFLNQERSLTKDVVDELIRNIDNIVEIKQEEL